MSPSDPGPDFDPNSLPEWARKAFMDALETVTPKPKPSALTYRQTAAWQLLVEASVVSGFMPRELAPGNLDGPARAEAEKVVLKFSETTTSPEGTKWCLRPETRAAVIGETLRSGAIGEALGRTFGRFSDPISRALQALLGSQTGADSAADLALLEARRIAAALLAGVQGVTLPRLDDLDRKIELGRMLGQFGRMIGRGPDGRERFFGRADEIEQLRDYVGVLPADSYLDLGKRAVNVLRRALTGRAPLTVWGIGGVGKTTLLSKFMLEHAEAAASQFPFAYLDFDRSTVSARNRSRLLTEMCGQVGAQFPELTAPMDALIARVQAVAVKMAARPEGDSISLLRPHLAEFRKRVDDHLAKMESMLSASRPFLLVFDTFEIVQYSADDVLRLEEFVGALSGPPPSIVWPRLRLIISGRKRVDGFLGDVEALPLEALDYDGSVEMLMTLVADAGKSLPKRDADALVAAVARVGGERQHGVHPLRLCLVADIIEKTKGSGKAVAKALLEELSRPLDFATLAGRTFVDGILIRRVLGHVSDDRVRALADPGLVVRRITPDVIRRVMAPGTPDPKAPKPKDNEPDTRPMWTIGAEEAADIFKAFGREVTLVEPDGDALRHRSDVRREMLPLIRARSRTQFDRLHRLAYDFYAQALRDDPADAAAAAEAIYHGLWLDKPIQSVDALWPRTAWFDPRIDPEDFPDNSSGDIYLRARRGRPLAVGDLRRLSPTIALEWLERRSTDLLDERRVDDALAAMRSVCGPGYAGLDGRPAVAATVARLLYRAGCWDEAMTLAHRHIDRPLESPWSILRTWTTIVAKAPAQRDKPARAVEAAAAVSDPIVGVELLAHATLLVAHQENWAAAAGLREQVRRLGAAAPMELWTRGLRVMRLFILAAAGDTRPYLAAYAEASERLPRDVDLTDDVERVMRMLVQKPSGLDPVFQSIRKGKSRQPGLEQLDEMWRQARPAAVTAIQERPDLARAVLRLVAHDHADWRWVIGNALSRELQDSNEPLLAALGDAGLLPPRPRGHAGEAINGMEIVQFLVDEGRMLPLARFLVEWVKETRGVGGLGLERPQDVFGIARALLRWHATILSMPGLRA